MEQNKKALQEKYVELQLMDEQIKEVQKHMLHFDQQISEVSNVRNALEQFRDVKQGEDALIPLANGIFVRAKLSNLDELIVNVGSNIAVKKSLEETKKLLDEQSAEIQGIRARIATQLEQLASKAQVLQAELMKLIEEK
ncbi:prefoldin subunit alpha [Candidatus Woesearchaeota archaeon]|nr:prefoldin subunit alpha [Candidatus Woesearchaeota archaeon]